jgi:hypothetical protein
VLAWDITLVPGPVKGQHYYLYMVMDVWSRRILGVDQQHPRCCIRRHFGEANEICAVRQQTYDKAYQENPGRWCLLPRWWRQPEVVKINHPRPEK